jgi:hypothetical protein
MLFGTKMMDNIDVTRFKLPKQTFYAHLAK